MTGVICCSGAYLCWAGLGKLITGHSGLFFLDPDIMVEMPEAILAACVTFIAISPGGKFPTQKEIFDIWGLANTI